MKFFCPVCLSLAGVFVACFAFGGESAGTPSAARPPAECRVLLFHGGRPWTAQDTAHWLKDAGLTVTTIDSAGLAGLGGASIKEFLFDPREPEPRDLITPAFAELAKYGVVVVCAMQRPDQEKFFTSERLAQMRDYVRSGGGLLLAENAPAKLDDLLPVSVVAETDDGRERACRADSPLFEELPAAWPFLGRGRIVALKTGAQALAWETREGRELGPHIAAMSYGAGRIVYWNAEWRWKNQFRQLRNWVYFQTVLTTLVTHASGKNFSARHNIATQYPQPPVRTLPAARVALTPPEFTESAADAGPQVEDRPGTLNMTFANGVSVALDKTALTCETAFPGLTSPGIRGAGLPEVGVNLDDGHRQWNQKLSEMDSTVAAVVKKLKLEFKYSDWRKEPNGTMAVRFAISTGGWLEWKFAGKSLALCGRQYLGYGDRVALELPNKTLIESLTFTSSVRLGETLQGHRGWRLAVYGNPRGFAEVDFGTGRAATTSPWTHFGDGQPFNWLAAESGLICEFLDQPFVNKAEQSVQPDVAGVTFKNALLVGRRPGRAETPYLWHLFSPARPDASAWQAMFQFLRQRYCRQLGLNFAATQPVPISTHSNTCNSEEFGKCLANARAMGFVDHYLPFCPSTLESLPSEKSREQYAAVRAAGLCPIAWSAAAHAPGLDNPTAVDHPEWVISDLDGKKACYFGKFPIFNINDAAGYRQHYFELIREAQSGGLGGLALDMGGAQVARIDYAATDAPPLLDGAIEVYRFLGQNGLRYGIEGVSPLAMNNFWFRKGKYVDHTGREFALVGSSCWANLPDHLAMDYFRLGMNNAFFHFDVSPVTCGLESVAGEFGYAAEIGRLNEMFNQARKLVGAPFVQQTDFGTVWLGDSGAALFFWDQVDRLDLNLPAGWQVGTILTLPEETLPTVEGQTVKDIPHKCVILIGGKAR